MKKLLPWIPVVVAAAVVVASLVPPKEPGFHTREFGELPVLLNGRIQPLDSVARNALLQLRAKQTAPIKLHFSVFDPSKRGQLMDASTWLLELMAKPEVADTRKVFRVENQELADLLKLPAKDPEQGEDGMHYSYNQLKGQLDEIGRQAQRIDGIEAANRTPFERQVMKLQNALTLYQRLKLTLQPPMGEDLGAAVADFQKAAGPGVAAVQAKEAGQKYDEKAFNQFVEAFSGFNEMARFAYALVVPPAHPEVSRDAWVNVGTNVMATVRGEALSPAVSAYAGMISAYRQDRPEAFNQALHDYRQWLGERFKPELKKGEREAFYNLFQGFYKALVIYVLAFVLACVSWFNGSQLLRRASFHLIVLALVIHTASLIFRMVLEGRPPVTNLYSSAVFIGWAAAILGLVLERLYRDGLGAAMGSLVGFVTLVIAHNLALAGDTMEMLRAVLDTNFWLATHVVTVTLGYSATFVAGVLAIFYIIRGVFTTTLDAATGKSLTRMVYGIVCFATLFSFIGTVLGGIWADQSWGRFWGWDPKENGALLIVLWNAAILHARWGGWIRERGLMNMAIFGNIVTSFSWFGVNMLGVGLHSYGFMDAAFKYLVLFIATQVFLIGLGMLPDRYWKSFASRSPAAPPADPTSDAKAHPAPAGA